MEGASAQRLHTPPQRLWGRQAMGSLQAVGRMAEGRGGGAWRGGPRRAPPRSARTSPAAAPARPPAPAPARPRPRRTPGPAPPHTRPRSPSAAPCSPPPAPPGAARVSWRAARARPPRRPLNTPRSLAMRQISSSISPGLPERGVVNSEVGMLQHSCSMSAPAAAAPGRAWARAGSAAACRCAP